MRFHGQTLESMKDGISQITLFSSNSEGEESVLFYILRRLAERLGHESKF